MPVYLVAEDELYHHGVKNQKWGVRNYQYKDGSLTPEGYVHYGYGTKGAKKYQKQLNKQAKSGVRGDEYRQARTIPAGTRIYRTTAGTEANADGTTYVSYLEADRNHYKGGWIRQTAGTKNAYEHEFELKKDLKIPSRDEVKDVINQAVHKNQEMISKTVDTFINMQMENIPGFKDAMFFDELTGEYSEAVFNKHKKECIASFGKMTPEQSYYYSAQTFGLNKDLKQTVISELKKRGYNAMTDEASVGGQNGWLKEGMDPLIVFDGGDTLDKRKTTKISSGKERRALAKYQKWAKKARSTAGEWSDRSTASIL